MPLKVLCDENVPGAVVEELRRWSFDVLRAVPRTPDEELAGQALRESRIILTWDSDFANVLAYPPTRFRGIIRVKIDPPFPSIVIPALKRVFDAFPTIDHFRRKLVIVEASTFRVWEEHFPPADSEKRDSP